MHSISKKSLQYSFHRLATFTLVVSFIFLVINVVTGMEVPKVDRLNYLSFFNLMAAVILFSLLTSILLSIVGLFNDSDKKKNYAIVLIFGLLLLLFIFIEG